MTLRPSPGGPRIWSEGTWFPLSDAVDRRGRKVKQSSSEDLRKNYEVRKMIFFTVLIKKSSKDEEAPAKGRVRKKKQKQEDLTDDHTAPVVSYPIITSNNDIIGDNGDSPSDISESDIEVSDNDDSSSSTDVDDFTFDLTAPASKGVVHGWERWPGMGMSFTPQALC